MTYKPPFARMRAIKQAAPAKQSPRLPPILSQPANVEEALAVEPVVDETPAPRAPVAEEPEPETTDDTPESDGGESESDGESVEPSMDMKRAKLDKLAERLGVKNPDKFPNKQAVLDAIRHAQGG